MNKCIFSEINGKFVCINCGITIPKVRPDIGPPHSICSGGSPEYPTTAGLAKNFGKAMWNYAKSGFKNVTPEEYKRRLDICSACEFYDNGRCKHKDCGCFLSKKAWLASENCPENKWSLSNNNYNVIPDDIDETLEIEKERLGKKNLILPEDNTQTIENIPDIGPPLVVIVGTHRSLSSALAQTVEALGVNFGENVRGENKKLAQIMEDAMPFPTTVKSDCKDKLREFIDELMANQDSLNGIKYPTLAFYLEELQEIYPNLKIILASRPIEESIKSLTARAGRPEALFPATPEECEKVQLAIRDNIRKFLSNKHFLTIEADDLMANPLREARRIIDFLGITPSEEQIKNATNIIKPELAKHSFVVHEDQTAHWEDVTTICIKTFERPGVLQNCLKSIRDKYPHIPILVADDSQEPQLDVGYNNVTVYPMEYDSGLSAGRNFLMSKVTTPYVLYFDDDTVFVNSTNIQKMFDVLRYYEFDLVAGQAIRGNKVFSFECHFYIDNDTLHMTYGPTNEPWNHFPRYHLVKNFFIAKTEIFRDIKWDDELKMGEHIDWFLKAWEKDIKIAYIPSSIVLDSSAKPDKSYIEKRLRAKIWHELSMVRWAEKLNVKFINRTNSDTCSTVTISVDKYKREHPEYKSVDK